MRTGTPRLFRLIGLIALFVALGTPMLAYLWETLNVLMSGRVEPVRLGIAVVVLAVFVVLLRFLSRSIGVVEGVDEGPRDRTRSGDRLPPHHPSRRT